MIAMPSTIHGPPPEEGEHSERQTPPPPNPHMDLLNLRAMWSYATTEREVSDVEGQMWAIAPKEERKPGCSKWIAAQMRCTARDAEARLAIRSAAPHSDMLWDRVDGPERMALNTARALLSRARARTATERIPFAEAITRELHDYDTAWAPRTLQDGRTFRVRPQRSTPPPIPPPTASAPAPAPSKPQIAMPAMPAMPAPKPAPSKPGPKSKGAPAPATRGRGSGPNIQAWATVRTAINQIVATELASVDVHIREQLSSQCEVEIQSLMNLLTTRIRHAKRAAPLDQPLLATTTTEKRKLRAACHLLSVDTPGSEGIDHITYSRAKKNYRKLSYEYHPDRNPAPDAQEKFHQIAEAMSLIEKSYQARGEHP